MAPARLRGYGENGGTDDVSDLSRRAIRALARLPLFLALLLFLPAWSVRYGEAWVYGALFSACVVLITLYLVKHDLALLERRMEVGPRAEQTPRQKIILTLAAPVLCAVFVVSGLDHRFRWSSVPIPVVLAADAGVVASMLAMFRVLRENTFAASTVRVEANQRVISTGSYAWVRHPMYAAGAVWVLATPLALGSLWALLPAVLVCAALIARLLDEERYLSAHLPGYDRYRRTVRYRLIPFVW
jgi:protein-S-isoprenylcysteine O-methyltransferase Ste14